MGTGSGGPVPLEVGCVGLSLHESRRQGWAHGVPSLALKQHPHDVFSTFFFFFLHLFWCEEGLRFEWSKGRLECGSPGSVTSALTY